MSFSREEPARPDGYRPIARQVWAWGMLVGVPSSEKTLLVLTAARRLDIAHSQFERLRSSLEKFESANPGSPDSQRRAFVLISEAELAIVSLHVAIKVARKLASDLRSPTFPAFVEERWQAVREIRHAYEHIDERAAGKVRRKDHPDALSAFDHQSLVPERRIRYADYSFGVDAEATQTIIETRDFLVAAFDELSSEP